MLLMVEKQINTFNGPPIYVNITFCLFGLDKFGENILFVTVSKSPNWKTIVHKLFQHYGSDVPDLCGERTVRQLKNLLAEIGQSPMMLVLDDVWEGSEPLIDAFMVPHLSDYKVLVTSRVKLPRFENSCRLEPLCPEDSVELFRHFALPNDARSSVIHEELIQKVLSSVCLYENYYILYYSLFSRFVQIKIFNTFSMG